MPWQLCSPMLHRCQTYCVSLKLNHLLILLTKSVRFKNLYG
jgi:hypothetical protein